MMKIFLIAGEASGDIHGGNLIKELKDFYPGLVLSGTGGASLRSLGQKQYFTTEDMAIIGFDGVIKKLPFIFKMFSVLEKAAAEEKPDLIILVDYPGFNLRMARRLKKYGVPIVYFISPQFWVWDYKRVFILRDYCDLTISILPFEKPALEKEGVKAVYVGNPIIDNFKFRVKNREEFLRETGLKGDKPIIGILPGSRIKEVQNIIPSMVEAAADYSSRYDFVISRAENIPEGLVESLAGKDKFPVLAGAQYDIMKYADFIWACSGTVTLETAVMKKPMIIIYRSSAFNIFLGKMLSKLRMVGLPNIIAGREFIPEIVSSKLTAEAITACHERALADLDGIKKELENISSQFVGMTPCKTAAGEIYSLLSKESLS